MMEKNRATDQNFVWEDSLNVTTKMIEVKLNKIRFTLLD
jgi:hypothetical protein